MNFELTEEQRAFAESVRRFARQELAPGALARAHSASYPPIISNTCNGSKTHVCGTANYLKYSSNYRDTACVFQVSLDVSR